MGCSSSIPIENSCPLIKDRDKIAYDRQFWRSNEECCICLDNKKLVNIGKCQHQFCNQCIEKWKETKIFNKF